MHAIRLMEITRFQRRNGNTLSHWLPIAQAQCVVHKSSSFEIWLFLQQTLFLQRFY